MLYNSNNFNNNIKYYYLYDVVINTLESRVNIHMIDDRRSESSMAIVYTL